MRCRVCFKEVPAGQDVCPNCGFTQCEIIGNAEEALNMLNSMADKHRNVFLKKYDLGVNIFTWKDKDGQIALNEKRRLSFGSCDKLQKNMVWLDQKFARIPNQESQTVELSVMLNGNVVKNITVDIPALQEAQLQQLGIKMNEDLTVCLMLKNDSRESVSKPVSFM